MDPYSAFADRDSFFPSCIAAYLIGKVYHKGLARVMMGKLADYCDGMITPLQDDHLVNEYSEMGFVERFECDELAPALSTLYHQDSTIDTLPIRQILIPYLWVFERLSYYKEFHDLAKSSDTFAADMGRYVLFMKQREPTPGKGGDSKAAAADRWKTYWPLDNGSLTCAGCGGLEQHDSSVASVVLDPLMNNLAWKHVRCEACAGIHLPLPYSGVWRSTSTGLPIYHNEENSEGRTARMNHCEQCGLGVGAARILADTWLEEGEGHSLEHRR